MPFFCVKSVKFTPAKIFLHGYTRGIRDKLEVYYCTPRQAGPCSQEYNDGTLCNLVKIELKIYQNNEVL